MKKKTSKNERVKKIVGLRQLKGQPIDFPGELGFLCPFRSNHFLEWSEYNGFLWCADCDRDMPSAICMPKIEKAIEIYLDCIEDLTNLKD